MRKIVEDGYEQGDYIKTFRFSGSPNKIEKIFLKKLLKVLPDKPDVLDLGCGNGVPVDKYLVEHGCRVTGIDISQKHINEAVTNVPDAKFIKGDFSKFEFQKNFDAVISLYAIFHIPREEHKKLFLKIADLLKPEGMIIFTLGTSNEYSEEENWCGTKMAWSSFDQVIYKKMLDESGFEIIEEAFEGEPRDEEYHFWVMAKKK